MDVMSCRALALLTLATLASNNIAAQELEEIIVTASKRAESLQDVPISISTLDGSKVADASLHSLNELSTYVPNFMVSENAVATSLMIRGVGPGANQSFEQSVGLFVDGVHYPKGRQTRSGLFDIERVEVLRGPQGNLFGKNTIAGAVNVTTASARVGEGAGGKIAVSGEGNGGIIFDGNLNASTDTFGIRFAFKDRESDGYVTNSLLNSEIPAVEENLWRLSATWELTDNTTVKFKHARGSNTRTGGTAVLSHWDPVANMSPTSQLMFGVVGATAPQAAVNASTGALDAYRDMASFGGDLLGTDGIEGTQTETDDTSLNIDIGFGDGYTFTSVTGRSAYNYKDGIDADFMPVHFIGRSDVSTYDHISQELRIASPIENRVSFIAGVNWNSQEQDIDRLVTFDGTLGAPGLLTMLLGVPTALAYSPAQVAGINASLGISGTPYALMPGMEGATMFSHVGRVSNWTQDTDAWALFFQGTADITDSLSLTAGVRYTEEEKSVHADMAVSTGSTGLMNANPSPLLAGLMGAVFDSYAHVYNESRETDHMTPSVSLEWSLSDDHLVYASYSEAFKSGGFNAIEDQNPAFMLVMGQPVPLPTIPGVGFEYDDETASSIEIGGKHTFLDGSMRMNWAAFSSDYDDQQVSTFVGLGFVVANAAAASIDGWEMDLLWQASENLVIGANVAHLDATFASFPAAACTAEQASDLLGLGALTSSSPVTSASGCQALFNAAGASAGAAQDLAGQPLTHAPDFAGALFADYTRALSNDMIWFTSLDVNFTEGYLYAGDADPIDYQESYNTVGFRTGLRGERYEVMLYGRNITDEQVASGGFDVPLSPGVHAIYLREGAVWGGRFTVNF